jgi:hypothetical protein
MRRRSAGEGAADLALALSRRCALHTQAAAATLVRARVPVGEAVRPCRSGILAPRRRANLIRISYILVRKAALVLVPFFGTTNAPACALILVATLLGEATTAPKNGPGFGVGKWTRF